MFILDTDILSLLLLGQQRVVEKHAEAADEVALTVVTWIEVLQGRFASILKAEDGEKLLRAQYRLEVTERDLQRFLILKIDEEAAKLFDRLRQNKKVKMRRADLLIAAISLANQAKLVTRNEKDFRNVPGLQMENWAK